MDSPFSPLDTPPSSGRVIKIALARHAAEARLRAAQHEHEALQAKYFTPPMTAAEIKEMHASRWLGD